MGRTSHSGRTELRKAALHRRADAWKLLEPKDDRFGRGAVYLGGYAIECKLKAVAMEVYDCFTLQALAATWEVDERAVYTHGLEAFAKRLPLWGQLQRSAVWRDFIAQVNQWRPYWRYDPRPYRWPSAQAFMKAVDRVFAWLDSNQC
jgi:hypothetical protein